MLRTNQPSSVLTIINTDNKSMFQQLQIVGKGGFGKVWRVLELKTKKIFALKIIDKAKVITKKSVSSVIN